MKRVQGMQPWYRIMMVVTSLLIAVQAGFPRSGEGKEKPSVNIVGVVVDSNGKKSTLEYITIGGRYSQIPVYKEPLNSDDDPSNDTTKIDLIEVDHIIKKDPAIVQFRKQDYIRLIIVFKGSRLTKGEYIVERNRHVRGEEPLDSQGRALERELSFVALEKLEITGSKTSNCCSFSQAAMLPQMDDLTLTKTKKLLEEIEQTAQQLPTQGGAFEGLKSQLVYLIGELKKSVLRWFA